MNTPCWIHNGEERTSEQLNPADNWMCSPKVWLPFLLPCGARSGSSCWYSLESLSLSTIPACKQQRVEAGRLGWLTRVLEGLSRALGANPGLPQLWSCCLSLWNSEEHSGNLRRCSSAIKLSPPRTQMHVSSSGDTRTAKQSGASKKYSETRHQSPNQSGGSGVWREPPSPQGAGEFGDSLGWCSLLPHPSVKICFPDNFTTKKFWRNFISKGQKINLHCTLWSFVGLIFVLFLWRMLRLVRDSTLKHPPRFLRFHSRS